MKTIIAILVLSAMLVAPARADDNDLHARAERLAKEFIIADTHIDVPYRLREKAEDVSQSTEKGEFDYPRAKAGGLDAVFMSIYTPAEYETKGLSKELADSLIDMVEGFAVRSPDKFAVATSVSDVRKVVEAGKIALLLGMENGAPIDGDLENIQHFHGRGVRYITLTHSKDNHICDSSYDTRKTWNGLSPFGSSVVNEMNRVGIMIDISHVSDETFYQVMELTKAPVIASHSSCRAFTPGFERNMSDDMIKLLADKGGVIQINFGSVFISGDCYRRYMENKSRVAQFAVGNRLDPSDPRVKEFKEHCKIEYPVGFADVTDVADHIDHVVELVGVDYVGFGSDFDGVGDSLPTGLKDVSYYPNLVYELLKRGYTDEDVHKICSDNLFRVWEEVDRVSRELSAAH